MKILQDKFLVKAIVELQTFARGGVVAVLSAACYIFGSIAIHKIFEIEETTASQLAIIASAMISYFGHARFTFKVRAIQPLQLELFAASFVLISLLNWFFTAYAVPRFGIPYWLSLVFVSLIIPLFNYGLMRLVVFARPPNRTSSLNLKELDVDLSTPLIERFKWPKILPALNAEQQAISDDFMQHWHEVLPKKYGIVEKFNHEYATRILPPVAHFKTLELGAGLGGHLAFEDLARQDYHCIELRPAMAEEIEKKYPFVTVRVGDIQERLPYQDGTFDRVVAIHVLEHLPNLPATIKEVVRLLKPGGLFSIVFPCDPGLAYEFARKISAERIFKRRYKLPYGWLIRREHINSPDEILSLVNLNFTKIDKTYFPIPIPVANLNLCIGMTLQKPHEAEGEHSA